MAAPAELWARMLETKAIFSGSLKKVWYAGLMVDDSAS